MVSSVVSDEKVMNYINGEWVGSESEEYTDIINPANGDILGKVLLSTENDVQKAVNTPKQHKKNGGSFLRHSVLKYLYTLDPC